MELPKSYIAKDHEAHINELWMKNGAFKPSGTGEPFSILMPPPNANESLHVGHALFITLEDVMTRFARMQGKNTCWIPGTDHAGFETQVVFERKLQKEGKSRFDFTPEELRTEIGKYVKEQQTTILSQIKLLGASCDWDKLYFTLDQNIVDTAYQTFEKLNADGLLYRANRLVNYCTKHGTSFSDLEVDYEDRAGTLTYIKYPYADNPNEFLTVATTRPETMLGDTAIAAHPNDKRYTLGREVIVPLVNRKVPIIHSELVDMEFGSGAVKVTPAHSFADEIMAAPYKLEKPSVIDTRGKMTGDIPQDLIGIKAAEARTQIVDELKKLGLVEKEETINHRVGVCYKCKTPIEILPIEQWWIKTKPLAAKALDALKNNEITIAPKEAKKNLVAWLENIIDWNISRQVVWGIPIPAWFKEGEEPKIQTASPGEGWAQDKDTFDTWFSSTQLPFAALQNEDDLKTFFPSSVMETAADILYFWVARMIMTSLYVKNEIPFKHIYLHGLVLDAKGQKMSKSKNNMVNPLEIIDQYGTDALRWAVIHGTSAGQNFNMTPDRVIGGRNFANKIWNASRYVMLTLSEKSTKLDISDPLNQSDILATENQEILTKLNKTISDVTRCLNTNQYALATDLIFDFFWHEFCDKYLEDSKKLISDDKYCQETASTLITCLTSSLKMLHPFMPFVTEAIWQNLHDESIVSEPLLITAKWPSSNHES